MGEATNEVAEAAVWGQLSTQPLAVPHFWPSQAWSDSPGWGGGQMEGYAATAAHPRHGKPSHSSYASCLSLQVCKTELR